MKFALVGGDRRSVLLGSLLKNDGHRVYTYALEKAELPSDIPKTGCLQGCVYGADWVLLPLPAERCGTLNAPYTNESLELDELISALWPGQVLCAGRLNQTSRLSALRSGLQVVDFIQQSDFSVGHAAITAEGAAALLMNSGERCLWNSHVLITGWGYLAKLLALRFHALGAQVCVAARREGDRAMVQALGFNACSFDELYSLADDFDFVVNSLPEHVLDNGLLSLLRPDCLLLELAPPPGGFDMRQARALDLAAMAAPELAGAYAPYASAQLMRRTIYRLLREE